MPQPQEDDTRTEAEPRIEASAPRVDVYPAHKAGSPIVYLNGFADTGAAVLEQCRQLDCPDFTLVAISGLDWNRDLSPWPCDATISDSEPFAGEAQAFLDTLCNSIVPSTESALPTQPSFRAIAGYSLAGLFALWTSLQTDTFSRVASVSGSLWFPGFIDYARERMGAHPLNALYLSLGKKETRTPNRMMRHVLECTETIRGLAMECAIPCAFELNPGNHFSQPDLRTAKGITWLLGCERPQQRGGNNPRS